MSESTTAGPGPAEPVTRDATIRPFQVSVPDEDLVGWDPDRTAQAWAQLMRHLGYMRYVAQGGDVGAGSPTRWRGRPALFGGAPAPAGMSEREQAAFNAFVVVLKRGYIVEQGEHPQTIGYSLVDSPVGLAWMLDHDPDSYAKISHAVLDGRPTGGLTRDRILDNITLYRLTASATSAARMYWENVRSTLAAFVSGQPPAAVSLPVADTVFPDELIQAPRGWAEKAYPNLVYFNEVDRGGHFAAWEEPRLLSEELRAAFRSLRQ